MCPRWPIAVHFPQIHIAGPLGLFASWGGILVSRRFWCCSILCWRQAVASISCSRFFTILWPWSWSGTRQPLYVRPLACAQKLQTQHHPRSVGIVSQSLGTAAIVLSSASNFPELAIWYLLFAVCHCLFAICHTYTICFFFYLLSTIWYLISAIYYLRFGICELLFAIFIWYLLSALAGSSWFGTPNTK